MKPLPLLSKSLSPHCCNQSSILYLCIKDCGMNWECSQPHCNTWLEAQRHQRKLSIMSCPKSAFSLPLLLACDVQMFSLPLHGKCTSRQVTAPFPKSPISVVLSLAHLYSICVDERTWYTFEAVLTCIRRHCVAKHVSLCRACFANGLHQFL